MTTIAEIISRSRKDAGLNQSELARLLRITPQSVQAWESGRSTPRAGILTSLADALGIDAKILISALLNGRPGSEGQKSLQLIREMYEDRKGELEASIEGPLTVWDDETPLDDDEVCVPFLKEVELSAGHGRTVVQQSTTRKIRFGKIALRNQGVQFDQAVCVTVHGNSMEPVLPDGSTVGVDRASTAVRDGKMYAVDHCGQLRVKMLYRLPSGGIRMRSFNRDEHPDEEYSLEQMEEMQIHVIGRVFWSSVLW